MSSIQDTVVWREYNGFAYSQKKSILSKRLALMRAIELLLQERPQQENFDLSVNFHFDGRQMQATVHLLYKLPVCDVDEEVDEIHYY